MIRVTALAAVAYAALAGKGVASAPSVPTERFYISPQQCASTSNPGEEYGLPCFICNTLPDTKGSDARRMLKGTVGNITEAPTFDGNATEPPVIENPFKSFYTHCFVESGEAYMIFYAEPDCKGDPVMDQLYNTECPECSACSSFSDCGTAGCSKECCGFIPECALCQNEAMCTMYGEECEGCPGCSNENPFCEYCTDSSVCELSQGTCTGCPGCSIQPDPCRLCVAEAYCSPLYRDELCNKGNCPICEGYDPCENCIHQSLCDESIAPGICNGGACPICQGGSAGRRLMNILKAPETHAKVVNTNPFSRRLESGDGNFTNTAQQAEPLFDAEGRFALGRLYMTNNCSDVAMGAGLIPSGSCVEMPDAAGQSVAIKVSCDLRDTPASVVAVGYGSMKDCEAEKNETFTESGPEGFCLNPVGATWGITVNCTGWGKPPAPAPPQKVPGSGEIGVSVRLRYPDRRCEYGTGVPVGGEIRQCGVCTAEPGQFYHKINCDTHEMTMFEKPDCTGPNESEELSKCSGLGILRGIFGVSYDAGPKNSFGFFTVFDDGCFAENVKINAGLKSQECTQVKVPGDDGSDDMAIFIKMNCGSRTVTAYESSDCSGEPMFSKSFTNNQCSTLGDFPGFFRASCNGYQIAPPKPTTRTCAGIPRGCSKNAAGTCAGKSATWVVDGKTGSCECASTDKASKVVFKLKVASTTVAAFNADECNVVDFFRGVYNKVYEKTKSSIVSDYPVEIQTAPVQSGSDVVVEFAVQGFLETAIADAVVSYINTETASFVAAIEAAAANALGGAGVDISYVTGSAKRVDNVSFCGCKNLIDNVGSGAISDIQSNYLAQAIVAGIVAFAANQ